MKKWQINRVSTPERIFDKVQKEMAQPVGVFVFGADCDFKNEIASELWWKNRRTRYGESKSFMEWTDGAYR